MKMTQSQDDLEGGALSVDLDPPLEYDSEASLFDFNRLDRLPKSQLQSLHLVHENFVRSLTSSLSAYLRSYVALNLVSLEQISYAEFIDRFSSPGCIAYLGLSPYEGTAVLELSTSLIFGFVEILLGSKGRPSQPLQRKITDIEKKLTQTILRVILRDLSEAWRSVAEIGFAVQSLSSDAQLLHVLAPAEAVIVITIEVHVGAISGLMNLAIPSIFIKRLRHKFEQLQKVRKSNSTERDQIYVAQLLQGAKLRFEAQIPAGTVSAKTLINLSPEDILILNHPIDREVTGMLNGKPKCVGLLATQGEKIVFELTDLQHCSGSAPSP